MSEVWGMYKMTVSAAGFHEALTRAIGAHGFTGGHITAVRPVTTPAGDDAYEIEFGAKPEREADASHINIKD